MDHEKYLYRMSKIAPLSSEEMKILGNLHTIKNYKKNTIIDKQGSISKAVFILTKVLWRWSMKRNQKFL